MVDNDFVLKERKIDDGIGDNLRQRYDLLREEGFVEMYPAIVNVVGVLEDMKEIGVLNGLGSLIDKFESVDEYLGLVLQRNSEALGVYDNVCEAYGFESGKKVEVEVDLFKGDRVKGRKRVRKKGKTARGNYRGSEVLVKGSKRFGN